VMVIEAGIQCISISEFLFYQVFCLAQILYSSTFFHLQKKAAGGLSL
jgi:hypothetical protein